MNGKKHNCILMEARSYDGWSIKVLMRFNLQGRHLSESGFWTCVLATQVSIVTLDHPSLNCVGVVTLDASLS